MSKNRNYNHDVTEEIEDEILDADEIVVDSREIGDMEAAFEEKAAEKVVADETPVPAKTKIIGVVANCNRLNVRKGPSTNATVLAVIEAFDEVEIFESASTSAFYKVRTASGIDGYCMKKFIAIK